MPARPAADSAAPEVVRELPQSTGPIAEHVPAAEPARVIEAAPVAEAAPAPVPEAAPAPASVSLGGPPPIAEPAPAPAAPALKLEWPSDLVQIETDPHKASTAAVEETSPAPRPRRVRPAPVPVPDEPLQQVETRRSEPAQTQS